MKTLSRFLCVAVALVGSASSAVAEDSPLSFNASAAVVSDYMFRGQNLYDGNAVQPSLGFAYDTGMGTLSASSWAHFSADRNTKVEKFTEVDYTVAYSISLDPVTLKVGNNWYTYPKDSDNLSNTAEFFAVLALDDGNLLNPTAGVYSDYDLYEGEYYELGISHVFDCAGLGDGGNLTPYANFGFASGLDGLYADDGFVHATFGVAANIPVGDYTLTPSLNYTAESDDTVKNEFWFATTVAWAN